jgi:RimJ/RimL family protein N-acetyltransferase
LTVIETARLRLRRAVPSDLADVHAFMSDPRAMRYWATLPHESVTVTEQWFAAQFFSGDPARDEWIIEWQGRAIGNIGIWNMPEFGFILHPDAWGQGLATEAANAFLAYAFATYAIDAVTADVDPRNTASLGLLKKLGFVETGRAERTFLIGEEWCDSIYLALPRSR